MAFASMATSSRAFAAWRARLSRSFPWRSRCRPAGHAQSAADFYKGKTVELLIGYSGGGGYDVYARLLARHMGKHIPGNPTVVPRNMPGAGSLVLANWLY